MTTPTFNKFKSTTIYGAFNNLDYEDNSIEASANIQRNLTVGGDIIVATGNIKGKKLYYDDVDIASTFVPNTSLATTLNSYALTSALDAYALSSNSSITALTSSLNNYALLSSLSNYALLNGATFTGNVLGLTPTTTDNSTKFATTAFVKSQNYITSTALSPYALSSSLSNYALSSSLSNYALSNGATFSGDVYGLTPITTDNSTKFATTAFVKSQNYITNGGTVSCNVLNINQPSSTSSAILQFLDNTGATRALIYPSAISNVLRFTIYGQTTGYEWDKLGTKLMELDASGNLKITGNITAQNYSSTPDLSPYALLSGATFTGNVSGLTATLSDNSNNFATTAFVKGQNYITSTALSPYALSSSLSNYALRSGATFTGNVSGLTATLSDNTTKFATTAFVKGQNYITSSSLSPYALSSTLSNYALLSGATFTGTVNCNNGLTTPAGKDVHISCNNTFPSTNSGGKQGLGFFWNQTGGRGETNLLTYGQGGAGGLSIWNSNGSNAPSKIVEFYPDGSTFTGNVSGLTAPTADNSTLFATTAFVKNQNYLTSTTPTTSVTTLSGLTTVTFQTFSGTYSSYRRLDMTLKRAYINGMTQLNYSTVTGYLDFNQNTFNGGASDSIVVGIVSNPVPSQTYTQFVHGKDFNGAQLDFYATIIPNSSGIHYLVLKLCNPNPSLNQYGGTYSFPNFNLMYI